MEQKIKVTSKLIQYAVSNFVIDGKLREEPKSLTILGEEAVKSLYSFSKLIFKSEFMPEPSRIYFSSKFQTAGTVYDKLKKTDAVITYNTIRNVISYSTRKISVLFPNLGNIIRGRESDLESFNKTVTELSNTYLFEYRIGDELLINIPFAAENSELSSKDFKSFLAIARVYSKKALESVKLSQEQCAYYHYLVNNQGSLEDKEKADFYNLKVAVGLEHTETIEELKARIAEMEIYFEDIPEN
jgi:hypothetical protein